MSAPEEYLKTVLAVLDNPFFVKMKRTTYDYIAETAQKRSQFYPTGLLHKVLGHMHARIERGKIDIDLDKKINSYLLHINNSEYQIEIAGILVSLPLGLKSLAYSIKKGLLVDSKLLEEIDKIESASYIVRLSLISFAKAVVQTGQDINEKYYNKIVGMIGDSNSTVKIKAINAALKIGTNGNLIQNTLKALKKDSRNLMPNPVWSPGMLALIGIDIYRTKDKKKTKAALKIIKEYVTKLLNEKVLNGVLVIIWAMIQRGFKEHLPFLVLISLFSRWSDVRRSAVGLLIEYLGHNPSERSLEIIDSIKSRSPNIKLLLKFARISRKLLREYSDLLILEGTPLLIKRAVQLKIYAGEKEYVFSCNDTFSKIAGLRMYLYFKNKQKLEEVITSTLAKTLSTLLKIDMELLRLILKAIYFTGLDLPNSKALVLYSMNKNLFALYTLRIISKYRPNNTSINILRAMKTPTTILSLVLQKSPVFQAIEREELEFTSISLYKTSTVYPACIYLLAAENTIPVETAKSILFESLECYTVDPTLGDIGAYSRIDALYLLVCWYVRRKNTLSTLPSPLVRDLPMSVIVTKLNKKKLNLKLTKKEKGLLIGYILKLSLDKSRKLSMLIFSSILPSLKQPPKILRYLLHEYEQELEKGSVETAIITAGVRTLKSLLKNKKRKKEIEMMVCGLLNTFISSDGRLSTKILEISRDIFKQKYVKKISNRHFEEVLKGASKNTQEVINRMKAEIAS